MGSCSCYNRPMVNINDIVASNYLIEKERRQNQIFPTPTATVAVSPKKIVEAEPEKVNQSIDCYTVPDETTERNYEAEVPDETTERNYEAEVPDEITERNYEGRYEDQQQIPEIKEGLDSLKSSTIKLQDKLEEISNKLDESDRSVLQAYMKQLMDDLV